MSQRASIWMQLSTEVGKELELQRPDVVMGTDLGPLQERCALNYRASLQPLQTAPNTAPNDLSFKGLFFKLAKTHRAYDFLMFCLRLWEMSKAKSSRRATWSPSWCTTFHMLQGSVQNTMKRHLCLCHMALFHYLNKRGLDSGP